ncbi:hypothetical protein R3W88_019151 [Solanum pinnatisectum]|uniref:DUF4283 domain-containing protein n=1 Tax=Solanum pinnatisectum TaxID=50273 RepID=A0AAV9KIW0_9SOLN|nr:hypothetical protein R3W88_019151 [Solanum pinnatisectum]
MNLCYVPPILIDGEKVIQLEKQEFEAETEKWKQAVVLYVVGDRLSPKVYYHNDGYFVMRFSSTEDRDEVLFSGPYMMSSRPVIVKAWCPNFNFNNEVLRMIPLWVKLPNLPLNCWGKDSLSRIGSRLGRHLYADECTSCIDRISFARILVEMDITQVLHVHVKVQDPNGRVFEQSIEYEWKPSYCTKCLIIGHSCQHLETKRQDEHGVNKQKTKPVKMVWAKSRTQGEMSSTIATQQDTVSNQEKPRPKSEMASTKSAQHEKMFNKQENVITTLPTEQQVHDKEQQATISHQTKQMTSPKQNQDDTWKEARNNSFGKLVQTTLKNRVVPIANVFNPLVEEVIPEMENEKCRMNQGQSSSEAPAIPKNPKLLI